MRLTIGEEEDEIARFVESGLMQVSRKPEAHSGYSK